MIQKNSRIGLDPFLDTKHNLNKIKQHFVNLEKKGRGGSILLTIENREIAERPMSLPFKKGAPNDAVAKEILFILEKLEEIMQTDEMQIERKKYEILSMQELRRAHLLLPEPQKIKDYLIDTIIRQLALKHFPAASRRPECTPKEFWNSTLLPPDLSLFDPKN